MVCISVGLKSQLFLRDFNCKYNKIASAMLVNIELLNMVAEEKKHTFIYWIK